MKNKTIKYKICKFIYSIIGFLDCIKFKKNEEYHNGNMACIYLGKRTFYVTQIAYDNQTGVSVFDSRKRKYKFWQIGILDFRK